MKIWQDQLAKFGIVGIINAVIVLGFIIKSYSLLRNQKRSREGFLALTIFALALMVRIPWLWLVPRYSDELLEVNLGYMIYLGRAWPLHNVAHDIGAMHNYILGALFWILGPSIYWPRLYVTILSAITVVLIYILGKNLYSHWVGLVAAGLLLTNGMHILVTHMAWANCTTPFFFTLALMATMASEQKKSGKWLAFASLLWALALQTHSSVIVYVLVAAIYVARPGFRKASGINIKWYLASALAFVAGYCNMIYYNIISFGGSIRYLSHKSYALESQPGFVSYLHNLGAMLLELFKAVSSTYGSSPNPSYYLHQPVFIAMILLTILGCYIALKYKKALPFWMMIGAFAVIPWINHRYAFFVSTRYIMPVVLCALLLIALGTLQILIRFAKKLPNNTTAYVSAAVLLIGLIIWQSITFYSYCSLKEKTNESNYMALSVLSTILKNGSETVLLDPDLSIENEPLPYLLRMSQKKFVMLDPIKSEMNKDFLKNYWSHTVHFHSNEKVVAVLSCRTFKKLRPIMKTNKVVEISCQVTMPYNLPKRIIYVADVAKRE